MICPACGHDNIDGVDLCENCGMDLAGLDLPGGGDVIQNPLFKKPLRELPLKDPIVFGPSAKVLEAVQAMRDRDDGCVFVTDRARRLIGVFTERDLVVRVAGRGRNPATTQLGEVMTHDPVTLQVGDPLAWALHRMGVDGHRHLPILDGNELVGLLSVRQVMRYLTDEA